MNLSLASVSERIAGMEDELGATLLERTSRGVLPTPAGRALMQHARRILDQVNHMQGELRSFSQGLKGRIKVLTNTAGIASFVPDRFSAYLRENPDISIDIEERPSSNIVLAIAEGRAELGVVADIADLSALQATFLTNDQLFAVLPKAHGCAFQPAVRFIDLVDEPFVGVLDAALDHYLRDKAAQLGKTIHYRIRLRDLESTARLIAEGIGIAIIAGAAASIFNTSDVTLVALSDAWAKRKLYLCATDFSALSPHASTLASQLTKAVS